METYQTGVIATIGAVATLACLEEADVSLFAINEEFHQTIIETIPAPGTAIETFPGYGEEGIEIWVTPIPDQKTLTDYLLWEKKGKDNSKSKEESKEESKDSGDLKKGNFNKVEDRYLKQKGIDAYDLKKDFLGKKAPISQYDIYVNKDTGELFIFKKGGVGTGIPTGLFLK
ncbi:MAG: hypothetical protein IJA10_16075 [Lachnospiraceae bacterium]|nr:hypothetical protein [Lachnospiraceae bacterium]